MLMHVDAGRLRPRVDPARSAGNIRDDGPNFATLEPEGDGPPRLSGNVDPQDAFTVEEPEVKHVLDTVEGDAADARVLRQNVLLPPGPPIDRAFEDVEALLGAYKQQALLQPSSKSRSVDICSVER